MIVEYKEYPTHVRVAVDLSKVTTAKAMTGDVTVITTPTGDVRVAAKWEDFLQAWRNATGSLGMTLPWNHTETVPLTSPYVATDGTGEAPVSALGTYTADLTEGPPFDGVDLTSVVEKMDEAMESIVNEQAKSPFVPQDSRDLGSSDDTPASED